MIAAHRQGGGPVVTGTQGEEGHIVVAELCLGRDGLHATVRGLGTGDDGGRIAVGDAVEINHLEIGTIHGQNLLGVFLLVITHLGGEGELAPLVVITGQDVDNLVPVGGLGEVQGTLTVRRGSGVAVVRVGIYLIFTHGEVHTVSGTDKGVLGRSDVSREGSHHTVYIVVVVVLIEGEHRVQKVCIRVQGRTAHGSVGGDVVGHIVVQGPAGGTVQNAVQTFLGLGVTGLHILHRGIEGQPLGNLGLTGQGYVDTLVIRGLDNTLLVCDGSGTTDGDLVGTSFHGDVVVLGEAGLEEGAHIVIELHSFRITAAVTGSIIIVGDTVGTVGILVLDLGQAVRHIPTERVGVAHLATAGSTLLGGDDDSTVGSVGTVQGSGGGALQDGHRLDVFRVDIVTTGGEVHTIAVHSVVDGEVRLGTEGVVVDGNTIHNIQRLVVTGDGGGRTQNHGSGGTRSTTGRGDGHTGDTALESIYEALTARLGNFLGLHALDRSTYGTSHTFHTELGGNRGFLQALRILIQRYADVGATSDGNFLVCIAERSKAQRCIGGDIDGIITINIGSDTGLCPLDQNASTHDGLSVRILDRSLHSDVLCKEACTDKQHDEHRRHTCCK